MSLEVSAAATHARATRISSKVTCRVEGRVPALGGRPGSLITPHISIVGPARISLSSLFSLFVFRCLHRENHSSTICLFNNFVSLLVDLLAFFEYLSHRHVDATGVGARTCLLFLFCIRIRIGRGLLLLLVRVREGVHGYIAVEACLSHVGRSVGWPRVVLLSLSVPLTGTLPLLVLVDSDLGAKAVIGSRRSNDLSALR